MPPTEVQVLNYRIAKRPGFTPQEVEQQYGRPYIPVSGNPNYVRDERWERNNLIRLSTQHLPNWPNYPGPGGLRPVSGIVIHKEVAEALVATWRLIVRSGLHTQVRTYNGCFNPRFMRMVRAPSIHAYGAALDFDAQWNAQGQRPNINGEFVKLMEQCGWTWGGRWTGRSVDGMHFQWTDPARGVPLPSWQDKVAGGIHGHPFAPPSMDVPLDPFDPAEPVMDPASNDADEPWGDPIDTPSP